MVDCNIDTTEMRSTGQELVRLSSEFGEVLEFLYNRIENMNHTTQEWVGESADEYIRLAKVDHQQYQQMKEELEKYGLLLVNQAEFAEREIKSLESR